GGKSSEFIIDTFIHGVICDTCWAPSLSVFLILCRESLFQFSLVTWELQKITDIKLNDIYLFSSLKLHTNDLYHMHGICGYIERRSLLPPWNITEKWKIKNIIEENDYGILCIRSNTYCIGAGIRGDYQHECGRIDTYDNNMIRLCRGLNLTITSNVINIIYRLIPFENDKRLFCDSYTRATWLNKKNEMNKCVKY
ncbi:unnamed protein product, partial [Didymodactylos carnosus]